MKLTKNEVRLIRVSFVVFLLLVFFSGIKSGNALDWIYLSLVLFIELLNFIKHKKGV